LQLGAYVLLTVFLRQKRSPESKKLAGEEAVDADPARSRTNPQAPWPVRRGGLLLILCRYSLTIALFWLFGLSLVLHTIGGVREYNADQMVHGGAPISLISYLETATFWFESLQN